ncbi:MAG TPA: biotin--[acetyl-CoA-carboxylase] ligase [Leptolyngbyaceae cyanobacterium M65_K2018_010]|nr:biotin--[acetyl-CoA-carboxylase] ligase [Leptolyngbyaceae cyanobacterium M65_K2018_010]
MNLDQLRQALLLPPKRLGVMPDFWALRPRFQLHWVDRIDSTNRSLLDRMALGAAPGTVLMAASQNSGRGQWGRPWLSDPGGLYLSLGLKPQISPHRSHFLTLASTWGLVISLNNLGIPAQVKWPNDLVVNSKKLGGVLVETRLSQAVVQDAVIGLGLNCFNPVPATGTSLSQLNQPEPTLNALNSLETIAAVALYGLMQGYFFWQSQGDLAFLKAYQNKMAYLGQTITVNDDQATVMGIGASGHLRLKLAGSSFPDPIDLEVKPGEVTLGYNA